MTLKDAIRNPCEPTREPNDVEGCNKQSVLATVFWPDGTPLKTMTSRSDDVLCKIRMNKIGFPRATGNND